MRSSKVSRKLLSLLTITTLLGSSVAMAQLSGLTPGQVRDDNSSMDQARQREREARIQIQRDQERQALLNQQREEERRARDEFRREQDLSARRIQDQIDAQNQAIFDRQQAVADEAARVEAERQNLARQGSATTIFTDVTRKTNGEWLRVSLSTPQQLSNINISILKAAAKLHQVLIHTVNGQVLTLNDLTTGRILATDMSTLGDLRGISNRVSAIDIRAEAMGALAIISITVNSLEGTPVLQKTRFANK